MLQTHLNAPTDLFILIQNCFISGFHHFYLRNYGLFVAYLCTFGLFGVGWICDLFLMPKHVRDTNEKLSSPSVQTSREASSAIALILAVSPAGLLGFHHFYLNRFMFGIMYMCTFGLLGVGWVVDWFRVLVLVSRYNTNRTSPDLPQKTVDDAYVLWFPFGLLGFHHFYLERPGWGFLYAFTFGCLGIGWIVDACRMPSLVKECNRYRQSKFRAPAYTTPIATGVVVNATGQNGFYMQAHVGKYKCQELPKNKDTGQYNFYRKFDFF